MKRLVLSAMVIMVILNSCSKSEPQPSIPEVYNKIYGAFTITRDGDFLVITSKGLPDHKSPYYTGDNNIPYDGSNPAYVQNPNTILEQNMTFRIPLSPKEATNKETTPMGPIGIAVNGIPFYNQYAGPGAPLTSEINSFDQFNGHPQQSGQYHYHVEPLYITGLVSKEGLLGFLLDGFPVYGPRENGGTIDASDLDAYHGHFGPTQDFVNGIYHYHITAAAPYINGDGFFGTPGTVTQ